MASTIDLSWLKFFRRLAAYQQTDLPQAVEQLDQNEGQVAGVGQHDQIWQDLVQLHHHVAHIVVVLADLAPESVLSFLKPVLRILKVSVPVQFGPELDKFTGNSAWYTLINPDESSEGTLVTSSSALVLILRLIWRKRSVMIMLIRIMKMSPKFHTKVAVQSRYWKSRNRELREILRDLLLGQLHQARGTAYR
jgi:hypothetical protein